MPKKIGGEKRLRRRCPVCLKTKFRTVRENIGGIEFAMLICDDESCQRVLGGGPVNSA